MIGTSNSDPFFTNDLLGLAKLVGTILLPVIMSMWVFAKGSLTRRDDDLDKAINGVGKRVNDVEIRIARAESIQSENSAKLLRHEELIHDLRDNYAKVVATGDALRRELTDMQSRLAAQIASEGTASREQIHAVELEVAKLTEATRVFKNHEG